jgi:hypothetical protein
VVSEFGPVLPSGLTFGLFGPTSVFGLTRFSLGFRILTKMWMPVDSMHRRYCTPLLRTTGWHFHICHIASDSLAFIGIHKAHVFPTRFQHNDCTPDHHCYLNLQCSPSPPHRSPHRSVTAVLLTRFQTPSTEVGAPF